MNDQWMVRCYTFEWLAMKQLKALVMRLLFAVVRQFEGQFLGEKRKWFLPSET